MKRFLLIPLFILLCVLAFALTGCAPAQQEFQWQLHGTWVTETGEAKETVDFSAEGKIPPEFDGMKPQDFELNIVWPEGFRFSNYGWQTCIGRSNLVEEEDYPFHIWGVSSWYVPETDRPESMDFAIYPEEEFIVFYHEHTDLYLVASTDPDADVSEMLARYLELNIQHSA